MKDLHVLDLRDNYIDNGEELLAVLKQMTNLRVLYSQGNPFRKGFKYFKNIFINALPNLCYLDDKPVREDDRRLADAFTAGGGGKTGMAAIRAEKKVIKAEKLQAMKQQVVDFKNRINEWQTLHN